MSTAKPLHKIIQHQAYGLVYGQFAVVLAIALLAAVCLGIKVGVSLLAGSLCYISPNLFFVWRVFRYANAGQMVQFMTAFFAGEVLKLILSGILFLLVVKYLPISLLSVLIGFILAMVAFWVVCFIRFSNIKCKGSSE